MLFNVIDSHEEKIHLRDVLFFLTKISMDHKKYLMIDLLNIFLEKQGKMLEICFSPSCVLSNKMICTIADVAQIMLRHPIQFKPDHFYVLLDLMCPNCDSINSVISYSNESENSETSSNLIYLHSILKDDLFIKLMIQKSGIATPFQGEIKGKSWFICVIEAKMTHVLSFLFKDKPNLIINVINEEYDNSNIISKSMVALIMNKTDEFSGLRREFFEILISNFHKKSIHAIYYVKNHSPETSYVTLKAVQEIKAQYDFTTMDKIKILGSLFVTFVLGSIFYGLDIGYDYALLAQCTKNGNITECIQTCDSDDDHFEYYFEYTLIFCLLPFILNFILIGMNVYRNRRDCILLLPYIIAKHYCEKQHPDFMEYYFKDRPLKYHFSIWFTIFLWIPLTISFYPIVTKLSFLYLEYKIVVMTRALSKGKQNDLSLNESNEFFIKIHRTIIAEMIKSSVLEVVTEATFQPLLQLHSLTACDSLYRDLISKSFYSNTQVVSIITSVFSFAWSMTGYHVYLKRGALDFGIGLKSRLTLLVYMLLYILSRTLILSVAAREIFPNFEAFLIFIFIHLLLMSFIHVIHLYIVHVSTNFLSVDVWLEGLLNGFGSILLPSNIKFPRTERESHVINERYHERTSKRYIMMHLIILIENCTLAVWSWKYLPEDKDIIFTAYYPHIVLGIFTFSLICQSVYYQLHAWPSKPADYLPRKITRHSNIDGNPKEKASFLPIQKGM